jgi:translation elongation factor EF-4
LAVENNLEIVPVVNKIDIANIDLSIVKTELKDIFSFKEKDMIEVFSGFQTARTIN